MKSNKGLVTIKRIIFLAISLLLAVMANAERVSPQKALQVAAGFWNSNIYRVETLRDFRVVELNASWKLNNIYIVMRSNGEGFVIVSADDRVQPILAYSPNSPIDTVTLPCNTNGALHLYNKQIQNCIEKNIVPTPDITSQWQFYASGGNFDNENDARVELRHVYLESSARRGVGPLLTTIWNQSPLYNNLCPVDRTNGGYSVVGCVATAMSQVMKYWNHPRRGRGSNTYCDSSYADVGTVTADFGNTTYDWAHMPDELTSGCTNTELMATATLCFHCGAAVNMMYSSNMSGAITTCFSPNDTSYPCAENALKRFFRYSPSLHGIDREDYPISSDWDSIIKAELNAGRPILYSGFDTMPGGGGHAFVCDGYDNAVSLGLTGTYFHFNWGWGGHYNGYFTTNNLEPSGGGIGSNSTNNYTLGQNAIIGIVPDTTTMKVTPTDFRFTCSADTATIAIQTSSVDGGGWYAMTTAPWIHFDSCVGPGYGAFSVLKFTVDSNSGPNRTGTIIIRQGNIAKTISVAQYRANYSGDGYYGYSNGNISMGVYDMEILMRADKFGSYAVGDTINKVYFESVLNTDPDWELYDNNNFKISIYENPTYNQPLSQNEYIHVSNVLSNPVYSQNYFQTTYGMHEITLTRPYIIRTNNFWIGLRIRGASLILADISIDYQHPVPDSLYPVRDSIRGYYLYRIDDSITPALYDYPDVGYTYLGYVGYVFGFIISSQMETPVIVTAESSDTNRGIVIGGGPYHYGDIVYLNALPKYGYAFTNWQDGNRDNPRSFTLLGPSQNLTYLASFGVNSIDNAEPNEYNIAVAGRNITISGLDNGTIRIFDVMGRLLYTQKAGIGAQTFAMPTKGVYVIKNDNQPARKVLVFE